MSNAISAAFCDLSEISCHWGCRRSLFNSAGDCHVSEASATVSSRLGAGETYLNKRAPASPVGAVGTVRLQDALWRCRPPVSTPDLQPTCEHTQGWHKALPKRVEPNRIYITCDVHMMAQNWFVMPDLSRSITSAVVPPLWAGSTRGRTVSACSRSDLCRCCRGFRRKNVSFTVLKAFSQIAGQAVLICKQGAFKERLPCSVRANIWAHILL